MKEPFIFLCPEVSRPDAYILAGWMRDDDVTKHLSDDKRAADEIDRILERVDLHVLTHLFNRDGRFYMVRRQTGDRDEPVGFVRLEESGDGYEIVVVIGDKDNWDKKYGTKAVKAALREAFITLRAKRIIARIKSENKRSIRVFVSAGFKLEREVGGIKVFSMTVRQYLDFIKEEESVKDKIFITSLDRERIKKILDSITKGVVSPSKTAKGLESELQRAVIVEPTRISSDVITMNSRAIIELNGEEEMEVSLVYPSDADPANKKLSILSPIGTALIGYKEGSVIECDVPSGKTKIHIKKVVYQPEAAGDYHL